jgi:hypothetical protein
MSQANLKLTDIVDSADMFFALESEANELTESLYRSLLASIDGAAIRDRGNQ